MNEVWYAYVGMFGSGEEGDIRCFRYRPETGELEPAGATRAFGSPAYFTSRGRVLYAVSDSRAGAVAAFKAGGDGELTLLNALPAEGSSTCHLTLDGAGRHLYAANYGTGSLSGFALAEGGALESRLFTLRHEGRSVNEKRQESPHVHCMAFTPGGKWLCAVDLGTDRIELYRQDEATGLLAHDAARGVSTPAGLGPRHIAFAPGAYAVCELGSAILALHWDEASGLRPFQRISTLPRGWEGESTAAAIRVSADGRFVYASNRGHDSIACYEIQSSGELELLSIVPSGGRCPRDIAFDPAGKFLFAANQESDAIMRFAVDAETGALSPIGGPIAAPRCSCIHFMKI